MKRFTKEELKDTYILNDHGKLRQLYVDACITAGYSHQNSIVRELYWYSLSAIGTVWSKTDLGQTDDVFIGGSRVTLEDFEEDLT